MLLVNSLPPEATCSWLERTRAAWRWPAAAGSRARGSCSRDENILVLVTQWEGPSAGRGHRLGASPKASVDRDVKEDAGKGSCSLGSSQARLQGEEG